MNILLPLLRINPYLKTPSLMLKLLLVLILIGFLFVEIYHPRTMSTPGENDPVESLSDVRVQVSENESDSDETLSELQTRLQKLEKKIECRKSQEEGTESSDSRAGKRIC